MDILKTLGLLLFVGVVSYYGWVFGRTINYALSYEDMVEQTIEDKYEKRISDLEKRLNIVPNG